MRKEIKLYKSNRGITLIALIITIIVLLILAGVTMKLIIGENSIIETAKWAAYVTEYEEVSEKVEIYTTENILKRYGKTIQIATLENVGIETEQKRKSMYPVTNKININNVSASLKQTIKRLEGLNSRQLQDETLVNLYKIDLDKIQEKTKKQYVVNIVSGKIYSIEHQKYKQELYHTPRTGIKKDFQEIVANMDEEGTYELTVDAGQIVEWESIQINYQKYVESAISIKVFTSDDENIWEEETASIGNKTQIEELYNIIAENKTRYLKVNIEVKSVNGKMPELNYILVNFHKFKEVETEVQITKDGPDTINNIYIGKGTVTQIVTIPTEGEHILDLGEMNGTPTSTIQITNTDGTVENYTITSNQELRKIPIKPGSQITITTTLGEGQTVEKVKVLKKEENLTKVQGQTIEKKTDISGEPIKKWETKASRTYMYNNGGEGYWRKCLINDTELNETGIIEEGETNRIRVTYQVSEDGITWSNVFTNIQDGENVRYLKVKVEYQATEENEYSGNIANNKIKVELNDGSWKVTFKEDDEDETILFTKRVYFEKTNKKANLILPNYSNAIEDKEFISWKENETTHAPNTNYEVTKDTTLTAYYITPTITIAEKDVKSKQFTLGITTTYEDYMIEKYIYHVQGLIDGEDKEVKYETTSKTETVLVTGLTPQTTYKVYVEAKSKAGKTVTSEEKNVTTEKVIYLDTKTFGKCDEKGFSVVPGWTVVRSGSLYSLRSSGAMISNNPFDLASINTINLSVFTDGMVSGNRGRVILGICSTKNPDTRIKGATTSFWYNNSGRPLDLTLDISDVDPSKLNSCYICVLVDKLSSRRWICRFKWKCNNYWRIK